MKKVLEFSPKTDLDEEAALWLVRLDRCDLSEADKKSFCGWIERHPNRLKAFEKYLRLWGSLDALSLLEELFPLKKTLPPNTFHISFGRAASVAFAASLIMALFLVLPDSTANLLGLQSADTIYKTSVGEQLRVVLEDGSIISLNTDSMVAVDYNNERRIIKLKYGEGHFDVAKNSHRPFIVLAGDGYVKALGTAFSIRLMESEVDVVVSEGTVEVVAGITGLNQPTDSGMPKEKAIILTENGSANYSKAIEHVEYLSENLIEKRNAWQSGKWIFAGDSLDDVLREVQRYTPYQLSVSEPDIGKLKVGGVFRVGDVDGLLNALSTGFDLVLTSKAGAIELSYAKEPTSVVQ